MKPKLSKNRSIPRPAATGLLTCLISIILSGPCPAGELVRRDLSGTEKAIVYGSSGATFLIGQVVGHNAGNGVLETGDTPPSIDRWFRARLHGTSTYNSNFLDNDLGSALTPLAAISILAAIDIDRAEFSRDIPLFVAGIAATKGITDVTKAAVGRLRPCCRASTLGEYEGPRGHAAHSHSFFSGHSSAAFFSSTFLNRRLRRHMRQHWTSGEYRTGRILSPVLTFGWATFVGLSRIQADRHYFTDVAAGALVGSVLGELYYRLAYKTAEPSGSDTPTPLFSIIVPLN